MNEEPTIPGQLDTILSTLGSMSDRLEAGDRRMNDADLARGQMNEKLDVHRLMMADQSHHLLEQDDKLDALKKNVGTLQSSINANNEATNTIKDAVTTVRVGRNVLIWVAGAAVAGAQLWSVFGPLLKR